MYKWEMTVLRPMCSLYSVGLDYKMSWLHQLIDRKYWYLLISEVGWDGIFALGMSRVYKSKQ